MNTEYISNTTLEQLQLLEHWKNPVLLLMKNEVPVVEGAVNVYLTTDSLNERVETLDNPEEYSCCEITCIQAVDIAINQMCYGLVMGGLAPETLFIAREELSKIKESVDKIITMMKVSSEVITKKQAFDELQEKEFYLLGELSRESVGQNEVDVDLMRGENNVYDRVKLFITEDRAVEENTRNFKINSYPLKEIASIIKGKYAIIMEPYEEYHLVFEKEEINELV